ncbi:MAG: EamA family transporter [Spirochaetaceae bacterium]|nr:MAG: EamA family transporter [Spirochaetaceae bacterium]
MTAVLSLLAAFAGYSIHAIAQAGQKIGLAIAEQRRTKGLLVWVLSTVSMPLAIFLVLYAVSTGNAAIVGAMSGSGLASLAVFSHLYMHERITKREIVGVFTIVTAAILIGSFQLEPTAKETSLSTLYIYLPVVCLTYMILWTLFRKRGHIVGIVISGLAGALGGFVPLFQKVSTSSLGLSRAVLHLQFQRENTLTTLLQKGARLLSNPWALAWIAISLISMVVMQFAYRRGKAIQLIPAFAGNTIAIPVVGGVLAFSERLHPLQWIGVTLILAGVLLLTFKTSYDIHRAPRQSRHQNTRRQDP